MKKLILLFTALLSVVQILFAQNSIDNGLGKLPEIIINSQNNIHFISPEPIQYADISTHRILGDMPVKNLLRIKFIPDSAKNLSDLAGIGVITIVGESFIAQYRLVYTTSMAKEIATSVNILPEQCQPLEFPGITMTTPQMKSFALSVLQKDKSSPVRKSKAFGMKASVNHIYTVGDHIFLDVSFENKTNLPYEIDELRFKIEDKKIAKATNVQSLELKPEWRLYSQATFKHSYRNVYVFKKVTFPGDKVLKIELTEKQISGRTIALQLKYRDLLNADLL